LLINVTNTVTGEISVLEISLADYSGNERYLTVQAVDLDGNRSKTVKIPNPLYEPPESAAPPGSGGSESDDTYPEVDYGTILDLIESGKLGDIDIGNIDIAKTEPSPLTPDGAGTVVDDVNGTEGEKEFITITSKEGNVYYLILDRQRDELNVYFLDAVKETDLVPLTEDGGSSPVLTPVTPTPPPTTVPTEPQGEDEPETTPTPPTPPETKSGGTNPLLIIAAVIVVGGIGYYVKIYKPKHRAFSGNDGEDEDNGDYDGDEDDEEDNE
jgi:hypothetical protein